MHINTKLVVCFVLLDSILKIEHHIKKKKLFSLVCLPGRLSIFNDRL